MIRVVLDSNVYISALLGGTNARKVMELVLQQKIVNLISDEILEEVRGVLSRDKFRMTNLQILEFCREIVEISQAVFPDRRLAHPCRDAGDAHILECAVHGKADFIVTGDLDLLVLKEFQGVKIIGMTDFLKKSF